MMSSEHFPHTLHPTLLLVLLILFLTAHSQPNKITPAPGSTIGRSPREVRLTFSEPVTTNATISLLPQDAFTPIPGITAQHDPQNPNQIFAPLPPLEPGTYTVQWQVESSDGHFVSGFYSFALRNSLWAIIPPWVIVLMIGLPIIGVSAARHSKSSRSKKA